MMQPQRTAWDQHPFELHETDPAMLSHLRHQVLDPWDKGIQLNVARMRELGVREDICKGAEEGFDLAVIRPLQPVEIKNYPMTDDVKAKLEARMQQRVANGSIQILPEGVTPTLISPVFAVPKGSHDIREITDLTASGLNDVCRDEVMGLPSVTDAVQLFEPGSFACKVDMQDGFLHLKVHRKHVMLQGVRFPVSGQVGVHRFLVFGGKRSPFIFQGTGVELRQVLVRRGLTTATIVYIDDWLIVDPTKLGCEVNLAFFQHEMRQMNWKIKDSKTILPCQQIEFTGVIIDSLEGSVQVTEAKRVKALSRIAIILDQQKVSIREAESLIGFLCHISEVVKGGRVAYRPLMEAKDAIVGLIDRKGRRLSAAHEIALSHDMVVGLSWWRDILSDPSRLKVKLWVDASGHYRLWRADGSFRWDLVPADCVVIFSDAANCGWGIHMGHPNAPTMVVGGLWTWAQTTNSINWKEGKAFSLALTVYQAQVFERFIMECSDNTAAVAIVNRLDSKSRAMAALGAEMRGQLEALAAQALAVSIPGVLNVGADRPSRAGEWLFARAVICPRLVERVSQSLGRAVVAVGEVRTRDGLATCSADGPLPRGEGVILWLPGPHRTDTALKAIRASSRSHAILLPSVSTRSTIGWKYLLPTCGVRAWDRWEGLRLYDNTVVRGNQPRSWGTQQIVLARGCMSEMTLWVKNVD